MIQLSFPTSTLASAKLALAEVSSSCFTFIPHVNLVAEFMYDIFASLILGILSVTGVFMCPKHTEDDPRAVSRPGRYLIVFTGFIKCCNVTNSVVPFSLFQGVFL